ncbi:hypothetical protein Kisp02_31640 [Kineosporia sp. NBRC 101731]|nr:hypothetical protein Kisp02_31640 [Kineosporia sp. NBRC 101731]
MHSCEQLALSSYGHGWDGLAFQYEAAREYLEDAAGQLAVVHEAGEVAVTALTNISPETAQGDVTDHLCQAREAVDGARAAHDGASARAGEAREHLEAAEDASLVGRLQSLERDLLDAAQRLNVVSEALAAELAASMQAGQATGGGGGDAGKVLGPAIRTSFLSRGPARCTLASRRRRLTARRSGASSLSGVRRPTSSLARRAMGNGFTREAIILVVRPRGAPGLRPMLRGTLLG